MNNTTQELSKKEKYKEYQRVYRRKNRERLRFQSQLYQKQNSERIKEYHRLYQKKNREHINAKTRLYRKLNNEELKSKRRLLFDKNKEKIKKYYQEYYAKYKEISKEEKIIRRRELRRLREKNNIQTKLANGIRCRINAALKSQKTHKSEKTLILLGCSVEKCKQHIESQWTEGMSWENHTIKGWHIDHIRPVNTFDLTDVEQQKQCFHYTNLRPLWAKENNARPRDGRDII